MKWRMRVTLLGPSVNRGIRDEIMNVEIELNYTVNKTR